MERSVYMVISIARQSVIIKCNLGASIMTGNYEFYYASGLLYRLKNISTDKVLKPEPLGAAIQELTEGYEPEDQKEKHLVKMLRFYKPVDLFDEQMKELFWMGNKEQYMWQELPKQ
jgi:hypothetical protein